MKDALKHSVYQLEEKIIQWRRDFHKYPEAAWTEFRTAAAVVKELKDLGYAVTYGPDVIKAEAMMGVPGEETLSRHQKRAISQGADEQVVQYMTGGKTGVVGVLDTGRPGPVLALRFDMDANDVQEKNTVSHEPQKAGFASVNDGVMHACGHDAHTAIGLGLAALLKQYESSLQGVIKFIFQPAEEGVRGAKAMVEAGVVDDADYILGMHIGFLADKSSCFICGTDGFLATTKYDALFTGVPAHAGAAPQEGRNALLAAANAAVNLHAISRHAAGISRINVGVLHAGSGRNVIPAEGVLKLETRGETSAINQYMQEEAMRIIQGAAAMHGVSVTLQEMGGAAGGKSDECIAQVFKRAAEETGLFTDIREIGSLGASEDFTCFLEHVQQKGGKGGYAMVGIDRSAGHHDGGFNFNETALTNSVWVLSLAVMELLKNNQK